MSSYFSTKRGTSQLIWPFRYCCPVVQLRNFIAQKNESTFDTNNKLRIQISLPSVAQPGKTSPLAASFIDNFSLIPVNQMMIHPNRENII